MSKYIDMSDDELIQLFTNWKFVNIDEETGRILWTIFSNNNRYLHLSTNKVIETGSWRWFASFIAENLLDSQYRVDGMDYCKFYCSWETKSSKRYQEVWNVVKDEIKYIDDYWDKK